MTPRDRTGSVRMRRPALATLTVLGFGLAIGGAVPAAALAQAQVRYPTRPGERELVSDGASLLTPEDRAKVEKTCDALLAERGIPIVVVTIKALEAYGASGWPIEHYATNLYAEWGIGFKDWNRGILLLIAKDDRKARIELGADWGTGKHEQSQEIMEELVIPRFKQGDFAGGIVAGVEGLDAMARDVPLPKGLKAKKPWWYWGAWVAFGGLAVFTGISLYRRGSSGWAWLFWGAVFVVLGILLQTLLKRAVARGARGSFGGGFSRGGGASGSW